MSENYLTRNIEIVMRKNFPNYSIAIDVPYMLFTIQD